MEFFNDKARKEQMIENTTKLHNEMLNNSKIERRRRCRS